MRVECPKCATNYAGERLGLPSLQPEQTCVVTVACPVCATSFDATITPQTVMPGWWARNVMRRGPQFAGHGVQAKTRE